MSAYAVSARGLASRRVPQGVLAPMNELLFGSGEQGAWYDPSDLSTLFQDTAGTTPVTAVEQAVALMLDKSGRGNHASQATSTKRPKYSRRVNLITGSEMTGGAGGTPGTAPDGWELHVMAGTYSHTVESGKHRFAATNGRSTIRNQITWVPNTTYTVEITLTNNSTPVQVTSIIFLGLLIGTGASATYYIDDVIGTQINPGTHKVKIVASFTGGTPLQYLYAGVGAGSSASGDVTLVDASIALSIDAHLPYQRVNTATDYDADPTKFPAYLRFDGVDDALQTGNIDFTGTDKMTVWAGVTKLSDAAVALLLESSANWNLNNGAFLVVAPSSPGTFEFGSEGTTQVVSYRTGFQAPINANLSMSANIGGPSLVSRINGVSSSVSTSSQGTGNYGNYPLYIGARNNTSLFFSGRIYSLIVRGAATPLPQIEAVENLIRQKMRLP